MQVVAQRTISAEELGPKRLGNNWLQMGNIAHVRAKKLYEINQIIPKLSKEYTDQIKERDDQIKDLEAELATAYRALEVK